MELHRVGVVTRTASREAIRTASELADWLRRREIKIHLDGATKRALGQDGPSYREQERYDLVIVLGGDGTLLSVARSVLPGVPVLGVNLGRLGFLTEVSRSELYPTLMRVLTGNFHFEERSLFDAELRREGKEAQRFRAFNDVVITKSALARIIELTVKVAGHLVARYRSDGLIVSTPNGSTAYNLSAGGPILSPDLPVAVITPICPHTLTLRPIVVGDSHSIEISLETQGEEVFLTVDGQEGGSLGYRNTVGIWRSEHPVRLVRMHDRTFYDSLREKLKWGG